MFYRELKIPSVIEISSGSFNSLDYWLKRNHIYFEVKILFTQKGLFESYSNILDFSSFTEVVIIKGGIFEEIQKVKLISPLDDVLLVAFGGGSVIDFVKMYAQQYDLPYISIPSTLSNDAIYSPIARLSKKGKKKSFGVKAPIGIIVDTDIIRDSPDILLLSGVGDLISNLSAVKDCRLAEKEINERVDKFAVSIAQLGANGLLAFQKEDLKSSQFIEQLANGLIVSGMAMVIANSSRPASGAEHLISHAIDEFFPAKSTLHGLQVAWAHLLLEKLVRKDNSDYEVLYVYFEKIGLIDAFKFNIDFTEDDFYSLIPLAINMRNRFTVLNLFNQSNV